MTILEVQKAMNSSFIKYLSNIPNLDSGDIETLSLAKEVKGIAILDETLSRNVAEIENIKYHGSIFLLFFLHKNNLLEKNEIKSYVDEMIRFGWRCSTDFYSAILDEIGKL